MCSEETEGLGDKAMKVIEYEGAGIIEINVTEIARDLLSQITKYAGTLVREKNLPHFECSIGIPTSAELEKNLVEYFTKYNKMRVNQLARELGIEVEEVKINQQKSSCAPHHYES